MSDNGKIKLDISTTPIQGIYEVKAGGNQLLISPEAMVVFKGEIGKRKMWKSENAKGSTYKWLSRKRKEIYEDVLDLGEYIRSDELNDKAALQGKLSTTGLFDESLDDVLIRNTPVKGIFQMLASNDAYSLDYMYDLSLSEIDGLYYSSKIKFDDSENENGFVYTIRGDMINLSGYDYKHELLKARRRGYVMSKISDFFTTMDASPDTIDFKTTKNKVAEILVFTNIQCPHCNKFHKDITKYNQAGIDVKYIIVGFFNESGHW